MFRVCIYLLQACVGAWQWTRILWFGHLIPVFAQPLHLLRLSSCCLANSSKHNVLTNAVQKSNMCTLCHSSSRKESQHHNAPSKDFASQKQSAHVPSKEYADCELYSPDQWMEETIRIQCRIDKVEVSWV